MKRYAFPAKARLRRKKDFLRVRRNGVPLNVWPLRVRALRRNDGESRLGLAIRIRPSRSTVRNAWKRAIREAFRLHRRRLRHGHDIVVSKAESAPPEATRRVEGAFLRIVRQLNDVVAEAEDR